MPCLIFVTRYIEHVPDFLQALTELTKNAGIYQFAQQFLTIAEEYFEKPPELVDQHKGLAHTDQRGLPGAPTD